MRRRLNESRVGKQRPQASPTGYCCYDRAPTILTNDEAFAAFDPETVAGFDDTDLASLVWPGLTTVRQPIRAMAKRAAELLFAGQEEQVVLPFEIIERGSTAAA